MTEHEARALLMGEAWAFWSRFGLVLLLVLLLVVIFRRRVIAATDRLVRRLGL